MAKPKNKRNSLLLKILNLVSEDRPVKVSNHLRPVPDIVDVFSVFMSGTRREFYATTYRLFQDGYFYVDKDNFFRLSNKGRRVYDLNKLDLDIKKNMCQKKEDLG